MATVEPVMPEKPRCRADDCNRLARADGLCAKHRWEASQGLLALAIEPPCLVKDCENAKGNGQKTRASQPTAKSRQDASPPIPEEQHGTTAGYRYYKCRCAKCRQHHADEHRERRWRLRYGPGAPMGPEVRERILDVLRRSGNVDDAVAEVQVKHQAIYSAARAVPEFGALVRELTSEDSAS